LNFLNEEDVVFYPNEEILRAAYISSGKEILSQRLYAMGQLAFNPKKILITCASALLRYIPTPDIFKDNTLQINRGCLFDLSEMKQKLIEMGYEHVSKVEHSLQFASRGDILDVFSVNYDSPIRFEFFGDVIESIRNFNITDQISVNQLESAVILPATDLLFTNEEISKLVAKGKEYLIKDKEVLNYENGERLEADFISDVEGLLNSNYKQTYYKYYGLACSKPTSIIDYLNPRLIFVSNKEQFISSCEILRSDAQSFYNEQVTEGLQISHLEHYMPIESALKNSRLVRYSESFLKSCDDISFKVRSIISSGNSISSAISTIQTYVNTCSKVVLCINEPHQEEVLKNLLIENNIPFSDVKDFELPRGVLGIQKSYLSEGFECVDYKIAYISNNDLLGKNPANTRYSSRFKNSTILKSYEDLKPGDYVVHEAYGIGQYIGIKTMVQNGIHRDYLTIVYAKQEILYIPLEQFRMVRKFSGREGVCPKLSHLSTGEWQKKKAAIKARVNDLADKLYELYSERTKKPGYAFKPDDELQECFENDFPYTLTEDQLKSLNEIKADMESPLIMDRLLCGDVGFGKTEVAFRAAFKAIDNAKQVALLCPTTLLARQHYELAKRRFEAFGVRIAVFSRLIPLKQQKEYISLIKEGKIDLIIGTHRLLSNQIEYKDLGLLIIDEEQRFGVAQKEKIRLLKKSVDVLTLSATPIPRTLQMSLVGMRQLSQISTAPSERMPVQTYVVPYKEDVVDELINRELGRNGQVFYLYNRVEFIYQKASKLASRIRGASIGVVHGEMEKEEIEDVMSSFYEGKINVLVCTSIIENGIDVPNANMIIVEDADRFGLSQLYQIKGRVGRANKIAYAYLLYKEHKVLSPEAQKRLQAIQEFTDLGSGYKIAQRDLMIRGAGDILGPEQAGFIDSIGLDLYLKMLNEAVEEKKTGLPTPQPKPKKMLRIDAYIPTNYAQESDKIELYQEFDTLNTIEDIRKFSNKIRDVYGKIPEQTKILIQKRRIDLLLENEEIANISDDDIRVDILMSPSFSSLPAIGQDLFNGLLEYLNKIQLSFLDKKLRMIIRKEKDWLDDLENILSSIHTIYLKSKSQCAKRV